MNLQTQFLYKGLYKRSLNSLIQCVLERTQISDYADVIGIWNPDILWNWFIMFIYDF